MLNKNSKKAKQLKKSRNDNSALFEKYTDCTICLDPFKTGQKVKIIPGCQHIFHEKCCQQWLDYKMSCPNCNQPIDFNPQDNMSQSQPNDNAQREDRHRLIFEDSDEDDDEPDIMDVAARRRERIQSQAVQRNRQRRQERQHQYQSTSLVYGADAINRQPNRRSYFQEEQDWADQIDQLMQQQRENNDHRSSRQRHLQRRQRARQSQREARLEREERERLFMAGSIAFLRQFESQIPSLESQINLSNHEQDSPQDFDEEEKESEDGMQMNITNEIDEEMLQSSVRLQTNVSFELDEQDALHEQYQNQLEELRQNALRFRGRQDYPDIYYDDEEDLDEDEQLSNGEREDYGSDYSSFHFNNYSELDKELDQIMEEPNESESTESQNNSVNSLSPSFQDSSIHLDQQEEQEVQEISEY